MVAELEFLFSDQEIKPRTKKRKSSKTRASNKIEGSFLVASDGISSRKIVYLQRPSLGGYWTQYQDNAKIYKTYAEAKAVASKIRYNNPRVLEMKSGRLVATNK